MSTEDLRAHYQRVWREDASHEEDQEFIAALLEHHGPEYLAFHFELLRNQEHFYFYCSIRAAFERHGPPAEAFLIDRFRLEEDPELRGDALQILGHMRSKQARKFAKEIATTDDEDLRDRAVIVLGWVGTIGDMKTVLRDRLLHDSSAFVRGNAATAFRQIWYHIPRVKEPAIEILGEALGPEEDEDVIAGIVVSLQTIMKRRYGLREPDDGSDYVGDVAEAKERALRSLAHLRSGTA